MATSGATSARPDIIAVDELLDSVVSGAVRIPRFQRPYVWSPDDMIQLFDSVLRGYPIGSLLLWQTERGDISSLDQVGPIHVESAGPTVRSYVVDGHQRLATLCGVLRLPESAPRSKVDEWRWWIAYDLRERQFVHLRDVNVQVPLHMLPLRSVLRTVDFARRTREIIGSGIYSDSDANELVDHADYVQRAVRDYKVPVTVMKSGSLDDAVTIFSRVNQRGRDMTPDQMVSALTFRDKAEGDFDLAESIDQIQGDLRVSGFGDLERRVVLQVILAIAGLDFTRPSYDRIVNRDSHETIRPAVDRAKTALKLSTAFLAEQIGLVNSRLLPYASIMVMLAIYFDERRYLPSDKGLISLLVKWFWATSFNGWFAGANTTDIRKAADVFRAVAHEKAGSVDAFATYFFQKEIRPFPLTFDRRSARVRASLLVQLIAEPPLRPDGKGLFSGFDVFGSESTRDIPYFFPNKWRPIVSNPANRVILPEGFPRNARSVFVSLAHKPERSAILKSHFISEQAFEYLVDDDFERFIGAREDTILNAEKQFLDRLGLRLNRFAVRNEEEFDARE